ncbi:MAG: SPOR domain-containing protein [Arenicella sp.]|nr:SPOR domain-containing protein [Arenicella sp.]
MIRILGWLCCVFILANISLLLWPTTASTAAHIYAPKRDINPHFVRLNKEVEDNFYAAQSYTQVTENAVDIVIQGENCYRLGPFMHQTNFDLAQAVLFNAGVEFQKETRSSKTAEVYRVYTGPFTDKAQVVSARNELTRKNILDHFSRRNSDGQYIVSLGIYTTRETADQAREMFAGKLDNVALQQETVVLPNTSWLHFSVDNKPAITRQLERMDWGESAVKLGKYACLSI